MKYCLIGKKLSHSYSCDIHNGRDFFYELKELPSNMLAEFFASQEYDGFNVTIPYKKNAAALVDFLSEEAEKIGNVNTVKRVGDKLYGYNTDINGVDYMLKRKGITFKGKKVVICGTGGAAQTVRYCAENGGAKSVVNVSRSGEINYDNCYDKASDVQILFNATPVGMYPDIEESPVELARFRYLEAAFDLIYNPFRTAFLQQAEKIGLTYSNGLPMLVEQALAAEDIWSNCKHKEEDTEIVIAKLLKERTNVVLFGMPSAGKTSVGKITAEVLGRRFIDTDAEIEKLTGNTPSQIITDKGEAEFRRIESSVIREVAKGNGAVIAVGGGAVIKEENVSALRKNGLMFRIDRDLSSLSMKNRPISQGKGINALYEERKEYYRKATDEIVSNDGLIENTVKEIVKKYEAACYKRS